MVGINLIVSPVTKFSTLLSSSTELRFSTQSGSIGPSKLMIFLLELYSCACYLIIDVRAPSVHSLVFSLKEPNRSMSGILLGLILKLLILLYLHSWLTRPRSSSVKSSILRCSSLPQVTLQSSSTLTLIPSLCALLY